MSRRVALIYPAEPAHRLAPGRSLTSAQLMVLVSLLPPGFEPVIFEEQKGGICDLAQRVDVACISIMTHQASRGYEIADAYRKHGTPVVIGGMHASCLPQEALGHADAVVVGEAEPIFAQVLDDVLSGRSQGVYQAAVRPAPTDIKPFAHRHFTPGAFNLALVQATRGCPYDCSFCTVTKVQGHRMRARPVSQVIEEILEQPRRPIFFVDDNIVGDPAYAKALLRELAPLRRTWIGQASLNTLTADRELLELARESGCAGLQLGVESLDTENLRDEHAFNKSRLDSADALESKLGRVHDAGILAAPWIIFGFDHDDASVFERTVRAIEAMSVPLVGLPVCTPFPGTALHDRLAADGRILHTDWRLYDAEHVAFRPALMAPDTLRDGAAWASHQFYRWPRVLRRAPRHRRHLLAYLLISAGFHANARRYREGAARFEAFRRQASHARAVVPAGT
jgi:radical SAM superfamily enzyme YgiQ (UPF0313 family)